MKKLLDTTFTIREVVATGIGAECWYWVQALGY